MNQNSKWYRSMLAKHGSEQAVSKFMSEAAKKRKSVEIPFGGRGYFGKLKDQDPEKLKKVSSDGGKA